MEIEIGQLIRAIRRWWWIPVVAGLVLGLAGFGTARVTGSTSYTSSTQMLVTAQISGDGVLSDGSRTETFLALVTSGPVLDRVILELGLDLTRQDLVEDVVTASIVSGTQIIEIRVTTDDPELSAEIANSLSRNFVVTATDLSVGELQRNLDDLTQQRNRVQDRITVIEARLDEIDTEENAEDTQVQAEVSQLERERLQASQILADLDRSIRELTTNLNTMSIPVVVTDFAQAAEEGDRSVSPVLLALLGGVLGALLGAAWILWAAFTDRIVRSMDQVVSHPVLARLSKSDLSGDSSNAVAVLGARIRGVNQTEGVPSLALVSARDTRIAGELQAGLSDVDSARYGHAAVAEAALSDVASMRTAMEASEAVIVAKLNASSIDDLEELSEVLASSNTRILGTVVVK